MSRLSRTIPQDLPPQLPRVVYFVASVAIVLTAAAWIRRPKFLGGK